MARYRLSENKLRGMIREAVNEILNKEINHDENYDPRKSTLSNKNHSLNESAVGGIIKKWCYWCANYDYDFIEKAWADNRNLAEHLRSKFMGYYDDVGPYGVMTKFYLNLDNHNREILEDYVMTNFNG